MPNTKTKKFDFQIFLAVSMILLVICCSVVCIVVDNTENGVARAYTEAEIGVSNLEFSVTDGFYFKNLSFIQLKNVVSYLSYYKPGLFDFTQTVGIQNIGGFVQMSYNNNTMTSEKVPLDFFVSQYSLGEVQILSLQILVGGYDSNHISYFCNYTTQEVVLDSVYPFINDAGDYYFDLNGNIQSSDTFANKIVSSILGADKVSTVNSIDSLSFTFNNTSNLGCFISANHTFAIPPVVLPQSVYDGFSDLQNQNTALQNQNTALQNQITDLQNQITSLQEDKTALQNQITQLQSELDRYKTYYDATNWFNFIDSSYNNVKPAVFGDMKTTIKSSFDIGNGNTGVMLINDSGSGQGLIAYLDFGSSRAKGDLVRFSWKDLRIQYQTGSSGPGEFVPVHIAVLSGGSLIDCYTTTEDMMIDGSCEFTLPESASGIYLYNSNASTYIFVSGLIGQYYSYDSDEVYDNGYNNGFEEGKNQGMLIGRQEGYNQGVLDANDYSFFSLFSAVFDAPITAIVGRWGDSDGDGVYQREGGMLNFYIPGLDINFAPFLLSIFTLAIIIMIIRFILARKS